MRELKLALKDLFNYRFLVIIFVLFNFTVSIMIFQMYISYKIIEQKKVIYKLDIYNSYNTIFLEDKKTIIKFIEDEKLNFHFRYPIQINDEQTEALVLVGYYSDENVIEINLENKKNWKEYLKKYEIDDHLNGVRKIVFVNKNNPEMMLDEIARFIFGRVESIRDNNLINKYNSLVFKSIYTKMNAETRSIETDILVFYAGMVMFVIVVFLVLYKVICYIAYKMLKEYEIHIFYGSNLKSIILRCTFFYGMVWTILFMIMGIWFKKDDNLPLVQSFSLIQVLVLYIFYLIMLYRLNIIRRYKS